MFGGYVTANSKYQEILKLDKMLNEAGIPHTLDRIMDGWQICYPDNSSDCVIDAIEHRGSYGRDNDLLEIMGLLTPEESVWDSVSGGLTAENVFERICKHYANIMYPPHTHVDPALNEYVDEIIKDFDNLIEKAKSYGLDIKLTPNSTESLTLYFHDDHPDTILVDKSEINM